MGTVRSNDTFRARTSPWDLDESSTRAAAYIGIPLGSSVQRLVPDRDFTPVSIVRPNRAIQGPRLRLGTGRRWRNGRYSVLALLGLPRRLARGAYSRMLRISEKLWDRLIDYVRPRGMGLGGRLF